MDDKIQRYTLQFDGGAGYDLRKDDEGEYMDFADYAALQAERDALRDEKTPELPPLPKVDGYDKRPQGHYSAESMRAYAIAAVTKAYGCELAAMFAINQVYRDRTVAAEVDAERFRWLAGPDCGWYVGPDIDGDMEAVSYDNRNDGNLSAHIDKIIGRAAIDAMKEQVKA